MAADLLQTLQTNPAGGAGAQTKTSKYVLLVSTDLQQEAAQVLEYYRLHFQLEFIFRDSKQFMA